MGVWPKRWDRNIETFQVVEAMVFNFTTFNIPQGVTAIGIGSRPLVLTATENMLISGKIDVSGKSGGSALGGGGGGGGGGALGLFSSGSEIRTTPTGSVL